jgi:hypothetical protein
LILAPPTDCTNGSILASPTDFANSGDDAEEEPLDEEEDAAGGCIEEFDRLDISGGIDSIADKDLFDEEVVDEGNIFN